MEDEDVEYIDDYTIQLKRIANQGLIEDYLAKNDNELYICKKIKKRIYS